MVMRGPLGIFWLKTKFDLDKDRLRDAERMLMIHEARAAMLLDKWQREAMLAGMYRHRVAQLSHLSLGAVGPDTQPSV
jgi:hypothetical protein